MNMTINFVIEFIKNLILVIFGIPVAMFILVFVCYLISIGINYGILLLRKLSRHNDKIAAKSLKAKSGKENE